MLIKAISLFVFIIIWAGLVGVHNEAQSMFFLIVAPCLAFLFSVKFQLLPIKSVFKKSVIIYFLWLIKEIILSSVAVVKIAWRKPLRIQPILEPIKSIQQSDIGLVTYANSITLTPGTVTLSLEGDTLLVHALDLSFMDGLHEGEMDKRIKVVVK